jgi:hypothetical protein
MPDHPSVFISCTRGEVQRAAEISAALKRHGTHVVTDWAEAQQGGDWIGHLENALGDSDVFVLLVSEGFLGSQFAQYEWGFALRKQLTGSAKIIPVILDDVGETNLPHLLRGFPALDGRDKSGVKIADAVLDELKRVDVDGSADANIETASP